MSEVVELPVAFRSGTGSKRRDLEPRAVFEGLAENVDDLDTLLVIGITTDGKLYAACSSFETADSVLLVERFKRKLLDCYGEDEFHG